MKETNLRADFNDQLKEVQLRFANDFKHNKAELAMKFKKDYGMVRE